jgi:heavy metal sensor kinase
VNRLALRTTLTLWFAASILLILAPFLSAILVLQWRAMRDALDHHLEEDFEVAYQMLMWRDDRPVWRSDSDLDTGYDAGPQRWVEVYRHDGTPAFLRGIPINEEIRRALPAPSAETSEWRSIETPAGAHVRTLTVERDIGPERLWIRVARSEDALRGDFTRLILLFAIGAPAAVAAAAVAGRMIARRALGPLVRMAERARLISAEHLSERLPVENERDELGQLAIVFNDTFARLDASFERLKQFTADVSHQLRTPLTAIRSVGEVGLRESKDPAALKEVIGSMLEEADRLAGLVDTLLTLSRWESGRVKPTPSRVDLAALVREVAAQLMVLADDRGISMAVEIDRPLDVMADAVMIRQAIANVLDNAIKFTRVHGVITVSSRSTAGEHELIVDDEGPGIPADRRQHVFERFYQIDRDVDLDLGGTGLGLAIAHWAVMAHHGRIAIDDSPAGGTRVVVAMPRAS